MLLPAGIEPDRARRELGLSVCSALVQRESVRATSHGRLTWDVHFVSWTPTERLHNFKQSVTDSACICLNKSYSYTSHILRCAHTR